MIKKFWAAICAAIAILVIMPAHADADGSREAWRGCYRGGRYPAVVKNYDNVVITAKNGKQPKIEQVEQAILKAGKSKKWIMNHVSKGTIAGKIQAALMVRGKHTIVIEIVYGADKYSIQYKGSTNMNAALCEGKYYIHPNYNVWTSSLNNEIQTQLDAI